MNSYYIDLNYIENYIILDIIIQAFCPSSLMLLHYKILILNLILKRSQIS